ncbi:MAG: hypothetical protein RRZ71_03080 [Clostridia bacterium]
MQVFTDNLVNLVTVRGVVLPEMTFKASRGYVLRYAKPTLGSGDIMRIGVFQGYGIAAYHAAVVVALPYVPFYGHWYITRF